MNIDLVTTVDIFYIYLVIATGILFELLPLLNTTITLSWLKFLSTLTSLIKFALNSKSASFEAVCN